MKQNTKQSYQQAIDLLMGDTVNFRQLGINLAKEHPALFIKMVQQDAGPAERWCTEAVGLLRSGHKVNAIKEIRQATGLGLKEAKDVADNVHQQLYNNNPFSIQPPHGEPYPLNEDTRHIYDRIMVAV